MADNLQTIKGRTIEEHREIARSVIARRILLYMTITLLISLVIGSILFYLFPEKIEFRDLITLILAIGSIFSGLLGAAITFYFSNK